MTITWQQICKGSLYITVAGVLLHESVERNADILAGDAVRSDMLIAVSHVHLYFVKKSLSESIAMLPQVKKIHD